MPAWKTDRNTEEALPDTGTAPPGHTAFREAFSSGGVIRIAAGMALFAPLTSGLEKVSPAQALLPGASVTLVGRPELRLGSGPSCLPEASTKAAPG